MIRVDPLGEGGKMKIEVASPESVFIHLKLVFLQYTCKSVSNDCAIKYHST